MVSGVLPGLAELNSRAAASAEKSPPSYVNLAEITSKPRRDYKSTSPRS